MILLNSINPNRLLVLALTILLVAACSDKENTEESPDISSQEISAEPGNNEDKQSSQSVDKILELSAFKEIEWQELMPKDDLEALLNPPGYLDDIVDGSPEDQIANQVQLTTGSTSDDRYQQALVSTEVVPEMEGKAVKIPGFVVPVEFDENRIVTKFFLVPFFGACLHMPPPPPNQIIFVEYPEGLELKSLYDPFWISGILRTSLVQNDIATSSYSMKLQHISGYYEEE